MFGSTKRTSLRTVHSFSRTFNMPYITTSSPTSDWGVNNAFILYMTPSYRQAMVDVVLHYGWTHIYYIYNTLEGKTNITK